MPELSSVRNQRVKQLAALARRRVREQRARHLAEGETVVAAAHAAGLVEELLVTGGYLAKGARSDVAGTGVPVTTVSEAVMRHVTDSVTPQGIAALVRSPSMDLGEVVGCDRVLVLDRVADPGNVGAILRSAHAFGVEGVVATSGCADVFSPKTVRASAGTVYAIGVATGPTTRDAVEALRQAGTRVVGLDARGETRLEALARTARLALVLGSESHGIDETTRALADELVAIPMRSGAESLNVAVAAGIALYELRPRGGPPGQ